MLARDRFALNRIVSPSLSLADFYSLAAGLGLRKVELRNDLGGEIIDGMKAKDALKLAADLGIEVITINALQKFNLASVRVKAKDELGSFLELASSIKCRAIVLCPNNDAADKRPADLRLAETVESLKTFGPMFEKAGILGYVEPLGFGISSLASLLVAQDAIRKSGFSCYRIVHDTFHHYIGPDDEKMLKAGYDIALTGLIHISGVEAPIPTEAYLDEHRILVGPADRMKTAEQVRFLDAAGYRGDISFEPFSSSVQKMGMAELKAALEKSIKYVIG